MEERRKENRWIIQKNISSFDKMIEYIKEIANSNNHLDYGELLTKLKGKEGANLTSESTLGVRMSQLAFYMMGYKSSDKFVPSVLTKKYLNNNLSKERYGLLNLFSMQYPHPFSSTDLSFGIYIGRLLIKLLSDDRIEKKLYIDEMIWFLPFIKQMDKDMYDKLVKRIVIYRTLSYEEKLSMFKNVSDYEDVFSNTTHEINYYFSRIFEGMGVLNIIEDSLHNEGKLFRFRHGQGQMATYRSDAYRSGAKSSGYIKLNDVIYKDAIKLISNYSPFDQPVNQATAISRDFWIRDLYEFNMIDYLSAIVEVDNPERLVKNMIHESRMGANNGKSFECAVKEVLDLFEEIIHTEIISGSGDTDVLCVYQDSEDNFKFNVDSKKSSKGLSQINPVRITEHLRKNDSKYAIIITSRFSKGANKDIKGYNIINLEAETLGKYILSCHNSKEVISYEKINQIITQNYGSNISLRIEYLTDELYKSI